ncbi:cidABC operon transcriptional activator CidR [Aneurinibacillus terranovensis]|uniref:cidABC operon transcriptional activator CidR n=1 Tax=Aneurinibacillus terranovensis TaxID=278991 RepID=UPI00040C3842|nr:LysR family transcriptional regulator [Aneurinibacillus terranovensis]
MDIRHLNYFVEVARHKSFTKAAQSLHITQPTISKMVKNIEEELGVTLFERTAKQVELTDAGQIIFNQAQQIVKSFENLSAELTDIMHIKKGKIRMGLPPMIGAHFFPKVLGQFHAQYPQIAMELIEDGAKKVEQAVENGSLDIGVVVLPLKESVFHSFTFVREHLMLLVHPTHPFAVKSAVRLAELEKERFIFFREDFALHDRILEECIRAGFHPRVMYRSSQWDFISEMVAANLGIALLPQTICRDLDAARITVIPLIQPAIPWHLAMVWRKDKYLSFAAREWLRFTQSLLQQGMNRL